MVSLAQMEGFRILVDEGLHPVGLPHTFNTPIPGLILFADESHQRLEMLLPTGQAIDLLKVYVLAEDCVRHWHKDSPKYIPKFVGDFGRLGPLAEALNGRKIVSGV